LHARALAIEIGETRGTEPPDLDTDTYLGAFIMKTLVALSLLGFTVIGTGCASVTRAESPSVKEARIEARSDDLATGNGTTPRVVAKYRGTRENDAPAGGVF
jgi:hypothetical protein